jgi:hypothetical protein
VLEHLGVLIDTRQMRLFVTDLKVQRMRRMAQEILLSEILLSSQRNRRLVAVGKLRHFCGVAVPLTLALPMARFYTRSLYWDMSLAGLDAEERGQSQREVRRAERGEPSVTFPPRGSAPPDGPATAQPGAVVWNTHTRPKLSSITLR